MEKVYIYDDIISRSNSDCMYCEIQTHRVYNTDFPYSPDFICTCSLKNNYICIHCMSIGTLSDKFIWLALAATGELGSRRFLEYKTNKLTD